MTATVKKVFSQKSSSYPNVQNNPVIGGHRHSIGTITFNNVWPQTSEKYQFFKSEIPNFTLNNNTQQYVRFQEAEQEEKIKKPNMKCADIESSLESLCLQMMEHALGP